MTRPIPETRSSLQRGFSTLREASDLASSTARLARDLPPFLRQTIGLDEARARVLWRLETRDQRFLTVADRAIFRQRRSPYRRLLEAAGVQPGDLRNLVVREGLEGALSLLAEQGVYVTFDEMKGRHAAVRGSQRFHFTDRDFDNPLFPPHFWQTTGGTRGSPSLVRQSLALIEEMATITAVALASHGVENPRHVIWMANPTHRMLLYARLGQPTIAWFCPLEPIDARLYALGRLLRLLGRAGGQQFPLPQHRDPLHPDPVARELAVLAGRWGTVVVTGVVSAAARVAAAAIAAGRSLEGVTFIATSEPILPSRRHLIEASGARLIALFAAVEASAFGYSCGQPATDDDVHLFTDRWALVQRRRPIAPDAPQIDALAFTSLTPTPGKVLFNAEVGDHADVSLRDGRCCALGQLGLTTHLSNIRSFEKLTGEGTTFARTNLLHILDAVLPARFGGTGLDYQLVEEEAADATTRLVLRVHASVGTVDEAQLRSTLLDELGRGGFAHSYHAETLRRARSVEISRQPPLATGTGKILPFHLAQSLIDRASMREADARVPR